MKHAQHNAQIGCGLQLRDCGWKVAPSGRRGSRAILLAARLGVCVGLLVTAPNAYGGDEAPESTRLTIVDPASLKRTLTTVHPLSTPWSTKGLLTKPVKRFERVGHRQIGLKLLQGFYATVGVRPMDRSPEGESASERATVGVRYQINF